MFRLLFEESPSPKSIQDASFRLLKVNRAYCEMFGYEASDLIGRDPIDWMAADDREMILEQRQRALRGEHLPATLTRRILHRDGTMRICRLMRHTTHSSDGSRIELITLHDETEEIHAAAAAGLLERFVAVLRAGARGADDLRRGRAGRVGQPDARGQSRRPPSRPADRLARCARRGPLRAQGRGGTRQRTALVRDDGSTRWIDRIDRELEDLDGRPMRLTVVHDVTRERNLRDELIETEERFRQFAELVEHATSTPRPGSGACTT